MPNFLEQECPVCHRSFQPDDDVVVCPECGAPYHRDCWQRAGQCVFRDRHGTPGQWKPKPSRNDEDVVICGNCGAANAAGSHFCLKCGSRLEPPDKASRPETVSVAIAKPNGVSKNAAFVRTVDAAETAAADRATFIGRNAAYYLPRFDQIEKQNGRFLWNWSAAFFPVEWLLYRKMYREFLFVLLLMLLMLSPSVYILGLSFHALAGNSDAYETFLTSGQLPEVQAPFWITILSDATSTLVLFVRGVLALSANYLYYRHVNGCIEKIKQGNTDPLYYRYELSKRGGTFFVGVLLFLIAAFLLVLIGSVLLALFVMK